MPTPEEIASEQEKLYESASLRDDLNDAEATVLLKWGQTQVMQMAQTFPDDFEQKARFLRQLLKNINRFVGQREFNDMDGQREYMQKVEKYLSPLGYTATMKDLFAALPDDKKDMMANLKAILTTLTPQPEKAHPASPDEPSTAAQSASSTTEEAASEAKPAESSETTQAAPETDTQANEATEEQIPTFRPNFDNTEVIPDIRHLTHESETPLNDSTLENPNIRSINQADSEDSTGEQTPYDEKEE